MLFASPMLTVWVIGVVITVVGSILALNKWYK